MERKYKSISKKDNKMKFQRFMIKLKEGTTRTFSIDKIFEDKYIVSLGDSIYSAEAPVFNKPEDAFLFMLKSMSWIPSGIVEIRSNCDFLSNR